MRPLILDKLKQSTRIHHDRASNTLDILRIHLSIEEYRDILQKLWGFYKPLEALIAHGIEWPLSALNFDQRKKTPLLEYDLHILGSTPSFLPICTDLPELADFSQVLGCLYVLEGATLGGQVISRHIRKRLGLDQTTGCSYFCSYGAETNNMWNIFCHILATYASSSTIENQMLQAAHSTFVTFNAWHEEGTGYAKIEGKHA
ncbi:MAG TPA: biliverdin-producing heme oxygenase [Ktedonobacteraceae bacterium]